MANPLEQGQFIEYDKKWCSFMCYPDVIPYDVEKGEEGGTLGRRRRGKLSWDVDEDDRALF
jgi:hypothetical protein